MVWIYVAFLGVFPRGLASPQPGMWWPESFLVCRQPWVLSVSWSWVWSTPFFFDSEVPLFWDALAPSELLTSYRKRPQGGARADSAPLSLWFQIPRLPGHGLQAVAIPWQ